MATQYDPNLPEVVADPYAHYRELRCAAPVHWSSQTQAWVLTRYADVASLLHDSRFSSAYFHRWLGGLPEPVRAQFPDVARLMTTINFMDPPGHTRLRALYGNAFTPRALERLRPRIRAMADELIDAVQDSGRMDVIRDFATPLPAIISAEMFSLPVSDIGLIKHWFGDIFGLLVQTDAAAVRRAQVAARQLTDYLRTIIADRRCRPRDDLVSALLAAAERDGHVSDDELVAACVPLLPGGIEIQSHLGNSVLALLRHPEQLARLRDDPVMMPTAVEELLRFDSSVTQSQTRVALEDVEINGMTVREGQRVIGVLGAANRDPDVFPEPDKLVLDRGENRHLTFGQGIHYCLGAALARLVEQVALTALIERLDNLCLATDDLQWANLNNRGLLSLPITFSPRR